jgi:hypothetical protein
MSRLNSYLLAALVVAAPTVATAVPGGEQSVTRAAIDRVETSSTSSAVGPDGRAAFRTKHLFDGREWSGWGTAPGDVEGAWFSVRFDTMRYLTSLEFVPGHERDGKSYKRCGRPKGFTVVTERESRDFAFGSRRYKRLPRCPACRTASTRAWPGSPIRSTPGAAVGRCWQWAARRWARSSRPSPPRRPKLPDR